MDPLKNIHMSAEEDKNLLQELNDCGANVQAGIKRLNSSKIYEKIVLKFLNDKSYDNIIENINSGDFESATKAAHDLKGVSGNLSLDNLYNIILPIFNALRDDDIDKVNELLPELTKQYSIVFDILKKYS